MTAPVVEIAPPLPRPRRLPGRPASDGHVALWAVATCGGALAAPPVPPGLVLVPAAMALVLRRPLLLALSLAALAGGLGGRAEAGMVPLARGSWDGVVTLVDDPRPSTFGVTALGRADGRHVRLRASGSAAGSLAGRLAGERVRVGGRTRPLGPATAHLAVRHVVGQIDVDQVELVSGGSAPWRAANRLRRLLDRGAASLPRDHRAVFLGLVMGDDRHQSDVVADDFRGAGLTHLLAVSGQNVAFLLVAAAPLLRRLRLGWRAAGVVALLAAFTVLTRAEPSVLRAVTMAGLAAVAQGAGRPALGTRVLGLAVVATVLADPFLVRSVGYQLSVAASAGILLLAPRLARALPGPRGLAAAVAVPLGAQLAVAPLQLLRFGGLPVASVPANLLVEPAAALAATWGLPAGLAAGALGEPVAGLLHRPTGALIGWVLLVARVGAHLPVGHLGAAGLVVVALALAGLTRPRARRVAGTVLVVAVVAPAVALRLSTPPGRDEVADGAVLWRREGAAVLVLTGRPWVPDVLEGLRRRGVRQVGLVVVDASPVVASDLVEAVAARRRVGATWWLGASAEERRRVHEVRRIGGLQVTARAGEVVVEAV